MLSHSAAGRAQYMSIRIIYFVLYPDFPIKNLTLMPDMPSMSGCDYGAL